MAHVTVFGAGAMGTAIAMHAARAGLDTALWANPFDGRALEALNTVRKHPALPEHVPDALAIYGPDELEQSAKGVETVILASTSDTARSLAAMVRDVVGEARFVVSVAKGVDTVTGERVSEVLAGELPGATTVSVGGPCLASELAGGAPSAAIWASADVEDARAAGMPLSNHSYQLEFTDDVVGVEVCSTAKNVAAMGIGLLDGLGRFSDEQYRNAKAALFTKAVKELRVLVEALGGRAETAMGLAGAGDILVTSEGGRNRLYGELIGEGDDPQAALRQLEGRGMTVEGVSAARDVHRLAGELGLDLPYHASVYRVLFEGGDPLAVLDALV